VIRDQLDRTRFPLIFLAFPRLEINFKANSENPLKWVKTLTDSDRSGFLVRFNGLGLLALKLISRWDECEVD
jgi:hypothetical protein